MDFLTFHFNVSGIDVNILIPPLVAFVISFFTSMGGVSGAFLIVPFQMSVLGFTAPSVSSTNFLYNIIGIPGGVYRYFKEGRISWPLTWVIIAGTLPGVFFGYLIRIKYLPNPSAFKFFVGMVLFYIGLKLFKSFFNKGEEGKKPNKNDASFKITNVSFSLNTVGYDFNNQRVTFSTKGMFLLAAIVGIIGGIYGIGGGAIIAPFCVTVFRLPVYTVSGAALMGTFITSILGILFYTFIPMQGMVYPPDWGLGILFGIGGLGGMYLGAKCQKYFSERFIKTMLGAIILFVSIDYIYQFIRKIF
ncbi:MAG: sulfite exporter TauE/SafE family protein [Nitrospirae bacterium]|nr:sulfite exporter TauE/SafE family protein [Nitrospirota bacterium]MBF0542405.1 sulfite exporter TauE/SafE family protein [Nitrospirota bacterium]